MERGTRAVVVKHPRAPNPNPGATSLPACLHPQGSQASWDALGADPWVAWTMIEGYRLQFLSTPPVTAVLAFSIVADHQHREVLRSKVSTLLAKEAIREVGQEDRQAGFYSHYFPVPKRDGTLQPILGLRGLNKFIWPLRCKMLTVPQVKQAVLVDDWFATVDLKDAYFQIPIWEGHRRFLRFAFDCKTFEFCVLAFGISLAPCTFTRCMDAVWGPLQWQGLRVMNYPDNWLICTQTE